MIVLILHQLLIILAPKLLLSRYVYYLDLEREGYILDNTDILTSNYCNLSLHL